MNEMYVVITWDNGTPTICYENSKTPFIGSFDTAKSIQNDLIEWNPGHEYFVAKVKVTNL